MTMALTLFSVPIQCLLSVDLKALENRKLLVILKGSLQFLLVHADELFAEVEF
jgi:hypothetical protein